MIFLSAEFDDRRLSGPLDDGWRFVRRPGAQEAGKMSRPGAEFLPCPLFDDPPGIQDHDPVGVSNGR